MKKITLNRPNIGIHEYFGVYRVLKSGKLAQGEIVSKFEREFANLHGSNFGVACNSGTSALFLILLAMNIGPDDEVLVPAFTFGATANAVLMTGAKPIFVDVDLDSGNISYKDAKNKITDRTKGIIVVHLYGNPVNLELFSDFASTNNLYLIQDAAQAHLAKWDDKHIAEFGDALAFSFYPTKNMTAIEGGMILTNQPELAQKVSIIRNQGMSSRYVYELPGLNLRMTEVSAAIGIVQLRKLVKWTDRRIRNAGRLNSKLLAKAQYVAPKAKCVFHQFTLQVPANLRDSLRNHLKDRGIESDVYYPQSLTSYKVFATEQQCLNSIHLANTVISIPVHPKLSKADINYLASTINTFLDPIQKVVEP